MNVPHLDPYVYEPLPHPRATRLIQLHRDSGQPHGFSLTLRSADIDGAPPFCALSYTWKSANVFDLDAMSDSASAMVSVVCDGKELKVAQNALDFLCYAAREGLFQQHGEGSDVTRPAIFQLSGDQTTARDGVTPKHLWIDAICIAQNDVAERSLQVAIMGDIYQRSLMTIVWLGREDPHPGAQSIMRNFIPRFNAVCRIRGYDYLRRRDPLCTDPELVRRLGGDDVCEDWRRHYPHFFLVLMERRWFRRGWVVQEVVLKSIQNEHDVVVLSGSFATLWCELLAFLAALTLADWRRTITQRLRFHPLTAPRSSGISDVLQRLHGLRQIQGSIQVNHGGFADGDHLRREFGPMTDLEWAHTLVFQTVFRMRGREFTDKRDTIYGCYGLLSQLQAGGASALMPAPDYRLSAVEVSTRAAWRMVSNMPFLLLLNTIDATTQRASQDLPSWVPDFSVTAPGASLINTQFALRRQDMPTYDASGRRSPRSAFRLTDQNGLVLRGVKLSTISARGPALYSPGKVTVVELEWFLEMLISHPRSETGGRGAEESLCRTLIANIFPATITRETYPETWRMWRATVLVHRMRHLEEQLSGSGAIIMDLLQDLGDRGEWFPSFSEVCDAILEVETSIHTHFVPIMHRLWRRRDFFVTNAGSFGIGPRPLRVDDEVWLLEGGRTPFILRKRADGQFCMVGEAYVHGIMYGEAMTPAVADRVGPVTIL